MPETNPGEPPVRLWGGAFAAEPAPEVQALSRSIAFDWRLVPYDLLASKAHVSVLHGAGLLSVDEVSELHRVLDDFLVEYASGDLKPHPDDEDVHTALERLLVERLGPLGGKIRAGRSRNDQVATDLRLYLRAQARALTRALVELQWAFIEQAERHMDSPAPGFTHLQRAQPISFAHELLKHVHALARDEERVRDWDRRAAISPLGAGALAGSSLSLDPEAAARALGFDRAASNSIDAVSDRDFVAEFLFVAALVGTHLSRIGEEVVLWTSSEFGWARLDDRYATGSSIMPQKRNPDVAELARGKSGRLTGNLLAVLTVLKGLPFAYNRDLQEDKEPVFDSVDTLLLVLPALSGLVRTLTFDVERMRAVAPHGHSLATDLAEWLTQRGVPFREAHELAGRCVRVADDNGCDLWDLTDEDFATVSPALTPDVKQALTLQASISSRSTSGGTAPTHVKQQLETLRATVAGWEEWAAKSDA